MKNKEKICSECGHPIHGSKCDGVIKDKNDNDQPCFCRCRPKPKG